MSSRDHLTDLICSARQGDKDALSLLLTQYRPALKLIAELEIGTRLQRREDASDIVQRTEVDTLCSIEQFRGESEPEFSAWIKTILRRNISNTVRDNRAAKRDVRREQYINQDEDSINVAWLTPARGRFATASRHVIKAEAALKLIAQLNALPEEQKQVVKMRHLRGYSIDEISAEIDKTPASVAGLLRRGLAALRKQIDGDTSWI